MKLSRFSRCLVSRALWVCLATLPLWPRSAFAAGFTVGNLLVVRVGNGGGALTANGDPVFLDEYSPAGVLVQSVALPVTASGANRPILLDGTAPLEGLLNRTTDGSYVTLAGYATTVGAVTTGLNGTTAAAVNRVIARIDASGSVNTTTALTDYASGASPRAVVGSDGSAFWMVGGNGGVRRASLGATTSSDISTTVTDLRAIEICVGQLYASSTSGTLRVGTVGSGLPTTAGQTISNLPGFPTTGNPVGFFLVDLDSGVAGSDTLYVADEGGTIQKYSLVAGNWTASGSVAAAGVRGLAAALSGGTVTLYGTTGGSTSAGGGSLYRFVDATGYNSAIAGAATVIASASANTAFRGVAIAPVGPPVITTQPASQSVVAGTTATFTVAAGGSAPQTFQWRKGGAPLADGGRISGATTASLLITNVAAGDAGSYDVVVTNPVNPVTSTAATLTVNSGIAVVSLSNLSQTYNGAPRAVSVTTVPAGLAVTVTYNGSTTPPSGEGSYLVVATVNDPNYSGSATGTLIISRPSAVITIGDLAQTYDGSPHAVSVSVSPAVARVIITYNGVATPPTNAGVYIVSATVADPTYGGSALATLIISRGTQTVTVAPVATPFVGSTVAINATATSGLPITLSVVSGNATVSGGSVTFRDTAPVVLLATQAGNENVSAASAEFTVTAIKRSQTIEFVTISDRTSDAVPFTPAASASSGLPVTFTIVSGPAAMNGNAVTLTGATGTVVVRASQSGNDMFNAAPPVERAFVVTRAVVPARLVNFSTRASAGAGDQAAIAGFVIGGSESRLILVRAIGPGLRAFGVTTALAAPRLELWRGSTLLASNTGWGTAANAAEIPATGSRAGAFPLATGSADSVILTTLPPGAYTAIVSPGSGAAGASLVEVYDVGGDTRLTPLANLSTRAVVGTGDNTIIGGLVVTGEEPKQMLIRVAGPALTQFGVSNAVARPQLVIVRAGTGEVVGQNAGWGAGDTEALIAGAAVRAGAFPFTRGSADAALLLTLSPGAYTAMVTGVGGATGVALVEIYDVP